MAKTKTKWVFRELSERGNVELRVTFQESRNWVATIGLQDSHGFYPWYESTGLTPVQAVETLNKLLRSYRSVEEKYQPAG